MLSGLGIVGAQNVDSLHSEGWKEFLTPNTLAKAWRPKKRSPYESFMKLKLINDVNKVASIIKPRFSEGEENSICQIKNLIPLLNQSTAVILDSGGPHSVAMGLQLMKKGYQPVVMFNTESSGHPIQELATLLFFSQEAKKIRKEGKFKLNSPPVFIMCCHREISYLENDLPSMEILKELGIEKAIYLNEGDQLGQINSSYQSEKRLHEDLAPIITKWKNEIQILYTGIKPWRHLESNSSWNPICVSVRSSLPLNILHYRNTKNNLNYSDRPVALNERLISFHREHKRYIYKLEENKFEVYVESGSAINDCAGIKLFVEQILESNIISEELKQKVNEAAVLYYSN